jgi:hypothetical protein
MVAKKEKTTKAEPKEGERKSSRTPKTVERLTVTPTIVKKTPKKAATGAKKTSTPKKAKASGKKGSKKAKGGPKRATTAFILFSKDHRAKVVKANPEAAFGEVGKLLGEAWSNATAADKKKYEALAAKDKARYEKEKAEVCVCLWTCLDFCNSTIFPPSLSHSCISQLASK